MSQVTKLKKPFTRRIGRIVIRVHAWGLEIKGYRCRRWKRATWQQIASLADESEPILLQEELSRGARTLEALGAKDE